jgi:hypothetical protein
VDIVLREKRRSPAARLSSTQRPPDDLGRPWPQPLQAQLHAPREAPKGPGAGVARFLLLARRAPVCADQEERTKGRNEQESSHNRGPTVHFDTGFSPTRLTSLDRLVRACPKPLGTALAGSGSRHNGPDNRTLESDKNTSIRKRTKSLLPGVMAA